MGNQHFNFMLNYMFILRKLSKGMICKRAVGHQFCYTKHLNLPGIPAVHVVSLVIYGVAVLWFLSENCAHRFDEKCWHKIEFDPGLLIVTPITHCIYISKIRTLNKLRGTSKSCDISLHDLALRAKLKVYQRFDISACSNSKLLSSWCQQNERVSSAYALDL